MVFGILLLYACHLFIFFDSRPQSRERLSRRLVGAKGKSSTESCVPCFFFWRGPRGTEEELTEDDNGGRGGSWACVPVACAGSSPESTDPDAVLIMGDDAVTGVFNVWKAYSDPWAGWRLGLELKRPPLGRYFADLSRREDATESIDCEMPAINSCSLGEAGNL